MTDVMEHRPVTPAPPVSGRGQPAHSGNDAKPTTVTPAPDAVLLRQWRIALAVLAVSVVGVLALFADTAWSMAETWWGDRTYGHGFLIIPVSIYLVWRRRDQLAVMAPTPQPLGLALLAGAVLAWLVATAADVRLVQQVALVAILQSLVVALLGWKVTRQILFPLFFLFMGVPFGNFLIPTLQQVTAHFAVSLLRFAGVPVFIDGLFIHIPSGQFVVAEACAGIRFLISTVVLGLLLAYVLFTSWWRRALIVLLSIIIPIIANGLRAFGLIYLAHTVDWDLAVGFSHLLYGWILFSIVTLSLLGCSFAMRERLWPESTAVPTGGHARRGGNSLLQFAMISVAAIIIAASGPAYARLTAGPGERVARTEVDLQHLTVGAPWVQTAEASSWQPDFQGADAEVLRSYSNGERTVDLYIAAYAYQRQGAEIVNQLNRFGDEDAWRRVGLGHTTEAIDGSDRMVRMVYLSSGVRKRLVWYWYWVDGRFTGDPMIAKLLQVKARLVDDVSPAAVIAIAAEYEEKPTDAAAALKRFLGSVSSFRALLEALAKAPEGGAAKVTVEGG